MKVKEFWIEPYCERLKVFVGSRKDYLKYIHKYFDMEWESDSKDAEYCYYEYKPKNIEDRKRGFNAIWISSFDWSIQDQALMGHEILHCVFKILTRAGIEYCDQSEEAYTYLFQFIMSDIWKAFEPRNKKVNKNG